MRMTLRDVAVILLALESLLLMVVPLILTFLAARGVHWLRRKLPPLFDRLRHYAGLLQSLVERVSGSATKPLISAHAKAAQASVWRNALAGSSKRRV